MTRGGEGAIMGMGNGNTTPTTAMTLTCANCQVPVSMDPDLGRIKVEHQEEEEGMESSALTLFDRAGGGDNFILPHDSPQEEEGEDSGGRVIVRRGTFVIPNYRSRSHHHQGHGRGGQGGGDSIEEALKILNPSPQKDSTADPNHWLMCIMCASIIGKLKSEFMRLVGRSGGSTSRMSMLFPHLKEYYKKNSSIMSNNNNIHAEDSDYNSESSGSDSGVGGGGGIELPFPLPLMDAIEEGSSVSVSPIQITETVAQNSNVNRNGNGRGRPRKKRGWKSSLVEVNSDAHNDTPFGPKIKIRKCMPVINPKTNENKKPKPKGRSTTVKTNDENKKKRKTRKGKGREDGGDEIVHCDKCSKTFQFNWMLDTHKLKVHEKKEALKCPKCPLTFYKEDLLNKHSCIPSNIKNSEKPVYCDHCGRTFATSSSRKIHYKSHEESKMFPCPVCSRTFKASGIVGRHMKAYHSDTKQTEWHCKVCNKVFKRKDRLTIHSEIHNKVKKYLCTVCGQRFHQSRSLYRHVQNKHTGVSQTFGCPICYQEFKWMTHLKQHMKSKVHLKATVDALGPLIREDVIITTGSKHGSKKKTE